MKRILALALAALLLLTLCPAAGLAAGEEDAVQTISSTEEFLAFAEGCALESYSLGRRFSLTADIDLSNSGFAPIPYFAGTLKGNGHVILGLRLEGEGSRQGLFRTLGPEATVQNLNVRGTVAPGGSRCLVGGIVGENRGLVLSCSFEGEVRGLDNVGGVAGENAEGGRLRDCSFRGSVTGEHQVGGVVGRNLGELYGCSNDGAVNTEAITPSGESRFDLSNLTTDDFLDLTNIGGVAGENLAVLRQCRNKGDVGYPHTGYNVGGVAGKSAGFISGCSSAGRILGRRDVGGVAGQLIPYAAWDLSEGKLDALAGEIAGLQGLLAQAMEDAETLSTDVREQLGQMNGYTGQAVQELEKLLGGLQDGELALLASLQVDLETGQISYDRSLGYGVDTGALTQALYNLYGQSSSLASLAAADVGNLSEDIGSISRQIERIFSGLFSAMDNLSAVGTTYDLSASETYEHERGAIADSANYGSVEADTRCGGVAGSIAFELSFDMEDRLDASDYLLSNAKRYLFAAIRDCGSYGEIRAREDCVGGVVGEMELGAVHGCVALGVAETENGVGVGGVAGQSQGSISACWTRMQLRGEKYVGGVAGLGENIADCRAWTHIEAGREYLGAIAGWAEGELHGNVYVSGRPAGVDDVSRLGQAEPVQAEALLALEGVPADFDTLTLRFVAEGRTVETISLPFGGSVESLPEIPNKDEKYWRWDDFNREHIYHSMRIEGRYYTPDTAISSGEEPPKFLVEGLFYEGQRLHVADYAPQLQGEQVLDAYTLHVEGYEGELTVRMNESAAGTLYAAAPGQSLEKTSCTRDGTYVVFRLENGGSFAYVQPRPGLGWPLGAALGALAAGGLCAAVLLRRRKRAGATEQHE